MHAPTVVRLLTLTLAASLGACSYLTPYKLEVQQGNIMKADTLSRLKSGMTRDQVARILGTPLLTDIYHADRWDYVHYVRRRGDMQEQRKLTVVFQGERLARLEGDGAPTLSAPTEGGETPPPKGDDAAAPAPAPDAKQ
jgi:outer membrane protein assembly factor BamE